MRHLHRSVKLIDLYALNIHIIFIKYVNQTRGKALQIS
jgi:hypothetical protein